MSVDYTSQEPALTSFEFATATRIVFGSGTLNQIGALIKSLGSFSSALIVTGKNKDRASKLFDLLQKQNIQFVSFSVGEEPTTDIATEGLHVAKQSNCDIVIGFGGGSVLDAGKAIAALITNGGELMDYLEVIGRGKTLQKPSAPYIAIPTTSGTGAEVTRNAVLCSTSHQQKVSLRSAYMLPNIALVDPELTLSVPKEVTASTGLDALTQVLESFISNKANPITDAICREGLKRGARSLKRVYMNGSDIKAREDMSITSLFGGLALANAKLGAVHGFAGPIGGMFSNSPHGAVCASLLPYVIEVNVKALKERDPNSYYLKRFDEVAQILTGNSSATAADGAAWIKQLCKDLNVPSLSAYGVRKENFEVLVEKSANASSMQGNPIKLTKEELTYILECAL